MSESMPPNDFTSPQPGLNAGPNTGPHAAPGAGPGQVAPGAIPQDDKTIAVLTHLSGILQAIIVPLIVWILKKDTSPYLNDQAKEALNFQISILIYGFAVGAIATVTSCIHMGVGFFLIPLVYVFQFVMSIIAAIAANKGEYYRYPMCFRFVK